MRSNAVRLALAVSTLSSLLVYAASCRGSAASEPPIPVENAEEPAGNRRVSCGVCFAHSYQSRGARGYGTNASEKALDRLERMGIRSISLTPFGYQTLRTAISIRSSDRLPGGETSEVMMTDVTRCHERGISVMIKPHLWVSGGWRGELDPDPALGGWDAWFESYTVFLLEWARFAEEAGAEWFVVGVELKSSSTQTDRWRAVIAEVRSVYSGRLTYAANWDEVEQVQFWGELDAIGVQMFAPLATEGQEPTEESTRAAAAQWLERYRAMANEAELPLILTEAGVINRANSLVRPYEWPTNLREAPTETGDRHQRWAYLALINTFGQADDVIDIYWWKVFTDLETREEGAVGFSPLEKPAEDVLTAVCRPE